MELWADFLSDKTLSYANALYHQKMVHLYSSLVESVKLAYYNSVKKTNMLLPERYLLSCIKMVELELLLELVLPSKQ